MSGNIDTARTQARYIGAAISGDSGGVQTLGSMGSDPHPERLLAVGLAHAMNAISALVDEVESLQREVADLRTKRGIFR